MSSQVRALCAQAVLKVTAAGQSLGEALPAIQAKLAPNDRGLAAELCYGTLRHYYSLNHIASQLLQKPFKEKDGDIHALILIGLYQLRYMRIAPHAAVNTTVEAAKKLKKLWAGNLINAVLRNYQRRFDELNASIQEQPEAAADHPKWLIERIQAAWPAEAACVFAQNNARALMSLRVNHTQVLRGAYLAELAEAGIAAQASATSACGVALAEPVQVSQLPGFFDGRCSVQDIAAQHCIPLLDLQAGQRVLDACAAPGGKTGHILEAAANLDVTALDSEPKRLERVTENLARLKFSARIVAGDAAKPETWHTGGNYQRMLVDAPCSGTGVIRRHPDIKHLRRETDIANLAAKQQEILKALWPLLERGGKLLYTTCSILPAENAETIKAFLAATPDAELIALDVNWGIDTGVGRQLLPQPEHDGFFYSLLQKRE